jgi:hypothetical protein
MQLRIDAETSLLKFIEGYREQGGGTIISKQEILLSMGTAKAPTLSLSCCMDL